MAANLTHRVESLSRDQAVNVARQHEIPTKIDSFAFLLRTFVLQQNDAHVPLVHVLFHAVVAPFPAALFLAVHVHAALFHVAP